MPVAAVEGVLNRTTLSEVEQNCLTPVVFKVTGTASATKSVAGGPPDVTVVKVYPLLVPSARTLSIMQAVAIAGVHGFAPPSLDRMP